MLNLFCKHKYKLRMSIPCTFKCEDGTVLKVPIDLFICKKCGKRKVIRQPDCFYAPNLVKVVKLWKKEEIDLEDLVNE